MSKTSKGKKWVRIPAYPRGDGKVTRVIRTCLKAAYFGAFHSISSRKAPALLR